MKLKSITKFIKEISSVFNDNFFKYAIIVFMISIGFLIYFGENVSNFNGISFSLFFLLVYSLPIVSIVILKYFSPQENTPHNGNVLDGKDVDDRPACEGDGAPPSHNTSREISSPSTVPPREPLYEIMKKTERKIVISAHTLDHFTRPRQEGALMMEALTALFAKEVHDITFIILHPFSHYTEAHERFHKYETHSPEKSPREQILSTIRFFINNQDSYSHYNYSVYLSEYMPRQRVILLDDKLCYVNLYMYASDVDDTPFSIYESPSSDYDAVQESINKLLSSNHVIPLILKGKLNNDWQNRCVYHNLQSCLYESRCPDKCERWKTIRSAILGSQNELFNKMHPVNGIVNKNYKPGTFTLDDLENQSRDFLTQYLNEPPTLDSLIEQYVNYEWGILSRNNRIKHYLESCTQNDIISHIKNTLNFHPNKYVPLKKEVWYQEYSDVFRRIMFTFLLNNPDFSDYDEHPELTTNHFDLFLQVIFRLDAADPPLHLRDWLSYSIVAGIIGIDIKPNHAATSEIIQNSAISIPNYSENDRESIVEALLTLIDEKKDLPPAWDDREEYLDRIKSAQNQITEIVSFTDDYIETIFLMKFYLELIKVHSNIIIHVVPRSIRCGNDAIASDIERILTAFNYDRTSNKIFIHKNGPKSGGVDICKLDPKIIQLMKDSTFLDIRGARNYEMMQKVQKDAYFGFMIGRSTSEKLTGYASSESPFFFRYHNSGYSSFVKMSTHRKRGKN